MDKLLRKVKIERFKRRAKAKAREIKDYIVENKYYVLAMAGIMASTATVAIKTAGKNHKIRVEQKRRDTMFYDHSLGKWIQLKRKLTRKESMEVIKRRENGEKIGKIFSDMNLIK